MTSRRDDHVSRRSLAALVLALCALGPAGAASGNPVIGFQEDWADSASLDGWAGGSGYSNPGHGGVGGEGDGYLVMSTLSPRPLGTFSADPPYPGDWRAAGVDLVEFWLHEGRSAPDLKKVVVLEDAEDLLMPRSADNRSKVSSLLNIADGLLGEFLQMHLICTVNCAIDQLDPAIGRPGRLIACREFRRLQYAQAHRLAAAKGLKLQEQSDYSLAEIYRQPVIGGLPTTKQTLGFAA